MRILPMNLYTDRKRHKHGAPTPHAIVVWRRFTDGDGIERCEPRMKVTDLNGDDASYIIGIADYMAGASGMPALTDCATYLLDMIRTPDEPRDEEQEEPRETSAQRDAWSGGFAENH